MQPPLTPPGPPPPADDLSRIDAVGSFAESMLELGPGYEDMMADESPESGASDEPAVSIESVLTSGFQQSWIDLYGYDFGSKSGVAMIDGVQMEPWFFGAIDRVAFRVMVLSVLRSATWA